MNRARPLAIVLLAALVSGCGAGSAGGLPTGSLAPLRAIPSGSAAAEASDSAVSDDTSASPAPPSSTGPGEASSAVPQVPAAPAPPPADDTGSGTGPGGAAGPGSGGGAAGPGSGGGASGRPAGGVDTSNPTTVVGTGTPTSCTSAAVVAAVAAGGIITFSCGPAPVSITLNETAKVVNTAADDVVIDGGGLVTLSGGGARRILYLNTCDQAQGFTTSHCDDQPTPRLTVQRITLADGNATGESAEGGGGGAIFARGGRLTVVDTVFTGNRCADTGPDVGGAAIRVLDQSQDLPVQVVGSTFSGGRCSNGGGVSSIGVSWVITDSVFTGNQAVGAGANPARSGTPGGGSGGAVYADGNTFTIRLVGTRIEGNRANEGGGAVFFVSNDRTGSLAIESSTLQSNPSAGFETDGFPGIFFLGSAPPTVPGSKLA